MYILIYSRFYEEHVHHVKNVLQRLLAHGLYVKAEKCEFHNTELSFIGYVIGPRGVDMEEKFISVVTEWPTTINNKTKVLETFIIASFWVLV